MRKQIKNSDYTCDECGNIYNKHGRVKQIDCNNQVKIIHHDGSAKRYTASRLVYEAFVKEVPKNHYVLRVVGKSNSLCNLRLVDFNEKQHFVSKKRLKRGVGLYRNGELIDFWKSAKECALKNSYDQKQIRNYCNNKVKNRNFDFRWLDY